MVDNERFANSMVFNDDDKLVTQSQVYNKKLFLQNVCELSTRQELSDVNDFKNSNTLSITQFEKLIEEDKTKKDNYIDISGQNLSRLENEINGEDVLSLKGLNASKNCFINLNDFLRFNHLKSLDLSFNNISSLYGIDMLESLKTVNLSNNNLTDISYLSECVKLKNIDLGFNKLNSLNDSLQSLKEIKNLQKLKLKGNPMCLNYLYKEEVCLQLRSLENLDGEELSEADFEVSKKIKENVMNKEVKQMRNSSYFGNFSNKLRGITNLNKEKEADKEEVVTLKASVKSKQDEIEKLLVELSRKNEKIDYLENQLKVENLINKNQSLLLEDNMNEKIKQDDFNNSFIKTECVSENCKLVISGLTEQLKMCLDEISSLKDKSLNQKQESPKATIKKKEFKITEGKDKRSNNKLEEIKEENTEEDDFDIEEFLKTSLTKLDDVKSLIKTIKPQKTKLKTINKKLPGLLSMKLGSKKKFNFLKDKQKKK